MDPPEVRKQKYLELLKKQSEVNLFYSKANQEAQHQQKYDIQPVQPIERTVEEEMNDVALQRDKAYKSLLTKVKPDVARSFITGLGDEELILFNQVSTDFLQEIKNFQSIDSLFLTNLYDRYLKKYESTQGISIPQQEQMLTTSSVRVKEDFVKAKKEMASSMLKQKEVKALQKEINSLEKLIEKNQLSISRKQEIITRLQEKEPTSRNLATIDAALAKIDSMNQEIDMYYLRLEELNRLKYEKEQEMMVGSGLLRSREVEVQKYLPFGRYVIHLPSLQDNILNIKFPSKGPNPQLKRTPISHEAKEVVQDALKTGKFSQNMVRKVVDKDEIRLLSKACTLAQIDHPFYIQEDEDEMKRFELLRGEIIAGNNNPEIAKELKILLHKFMSDGRLRLRDAQKIMYELVSI